MHAPDGLLNVGTALVTAGISAGCVTVAVKRIGDDLTNRWIPLAGVTAAFLFAAQMLNFPVGAGTSGHILGAALAAILLGPYLGSLSATVVVVVQALVFADGGITALGYNVMNLAIVPAFGGYALYLLARRLLPITRYGVVLSTGLASAGSVVLAAAAFSVQWLFGATVPIPFDTVFGAMVGIHLVIGLGEGLICAAVMSAVLKTRPDLVFGAQDLMQNPDPDLATIADSPRRPAAVRSFAIASVSIAVVLAAVVSQFASSSPDGLESVAESTGMLEAENTGTVGAYFFADYATTGIANPALSLALAGVAGVFVVAATSFGMLHTVRLTTRRPSGFGNHLVVRR